MRTCWTFVAVVLACSSSTKVSKTFLGRPITSSACWKSPTSRTRRGLRRRRQLKYRGSWVEQHKKWKRQQWQQQHQWEQRGLHPFRSTDGDDLLEVQIDTTSNIFRILSCTASVTSITGPTENGTGLLDFVATFDNAALLRWVQEGGTDPKRWRCGTRAYRGCRTEPRASGQMTMMLLLHVVYCSQTCDVVLMLQHRIVRRGGPPNAGPRDACSCDRGHSAP